MASLLEALSPGHQLLADADTLYDEGLLDSAATVYEAAITQLAEEEAWEGYVIAHNHYARLCIKKRKLDKARSLLATSEETATRYLPAGHIEGIFCLRHQAELTYKSGDYEAAYPIYAQVLERFLASTDPLDKQIAVCHYDLGKSKRRIGDKEGAMAHYKQAINIYRQLGDGVEPEIAACVGSLGILYAQSSELDSSFKYFKQALDTRLAYLGPQHPSVATSYNNLGISYKNKGDCETAQKYFTQAKEIWELKGDRYLVDLGILHSNIGICYKRQGDFGVALGYYQKALDLVIQAQGPDHPNLEKIYGNLGICYRWQNEKQKAIEAINKGLAIALKKMGPDNLRVASAYSTLGTIYAEIGQDEKAIDYLQKELAIREAIFGPDHPQVGISYGRIADAYRMAEDYKRSLPYYRKMMALCAEKLGPRDLDVISTWCLMSVTYYRMGEADSTIFCGQKAINNIKGTPTTPSQNRLVDLPFTEFPDELLTALQSIARGYWLRYQQAQQPKDLEQAYDHIQLAVNLIDSIRLSYRATSSKLLLAQKSRPIYEEAIAIALQSHEATGNDNYLHQAFEIAERSKAAVLRESLQEAGAWETAGIPAEMREKERTLQLDLAFYEKEIYEEELRGAQTDSVKLFSYQAKLFDLKQAYRTLKQQLESDFPTYYRLKYALHTADIPSLQAALPDQQHVVVTYFWGNEYRYAFALTKDKLTYHPLSSDTSLTSLISQFTQQMTSSRQVREQGYAPQAYQQFVAQSRSLYEQLLAPVLPPTYAHLTLIPDGILGYLPFELLLTKSPASTEQVNYAGLPYLIRAARIRYVYAATLLAEPLVEKQRGSKLFAGFAPAYDDSKLMAVARDVVQMTPGQRAQFSPLVNNQPEVDAIASMTGGDRFLGELADEVSFKEKGPNYKVLHLAMHAFTNDQDPMFSGLVFSSPKADSVEDGFLHAYELYKMKLKAELAVLSACNTGQGKLAQGEGIMSLARAFRHAGCPSIVMSQWQADDAATADLMKRFYQGLKAGLSKDQALQAAKLAYLEESRDVHPHYWAAFVLVGDDAPVRFSGGWSWWWGLVIILGIVGMFWGMRMIK